MSVEVVIKNKQLIKKPLTIQDITMGKYACGSSDQYMRNTGEVKEGDLIVYNPKKIGRGIGILPWKSGLKTEITLLANSFSTRYDFELFYDVIGNIMRVWKTKHFEQEGIKFSADDLGRLCEEQKSASLNLMADIENILKDDGNEITIFGAMFPLYVETRIIKRLGIARDEEEYADYLHSLQCMDAYYAIPLFYNGKVKTDIIFGNYAITSETDTIFPVKPIVSPFVNDPNTGKPLECSLYAVSLYSYAKKKMIARVSFDDFCKMADIENCEKHDRMHVILKGISEERLEEMAAEGHADPLEGI